MTFKDPLLLLHGASSSGAAWTGVIPFLTDDYVEVMAPTALGHRGGAPLVGRASVQALTDHTESLLDEREFDRVHIAGNSLGGWMAIELARRGRALSVCALSPAGFWASETIGAKSHGPERVRRARRLMQVARPVAPLLLRSSRVRHKALQTVAEHGERLTPAQALNGILDSSACTAGEDLLSTTESIARLDPLPCPVTLAWGSNDKVLPPEIYGAAARDRLPQAEFVLLPGLGHVPMIDDPRWCARTIVDATRRAFL